MKTLLDTLFPRNQIGYCSIFVHGRGTIAVLPVQDTPSAYFCTYIPRHDIIVDSITFWLEGGDVLKHIECNLDLKANIPYALGWDKKTLEFLT